MKNIREKEIRKDFSNGVVTPETLGALIHSVNKLAENYEKKEREYSVLRTNTPSYFDRDDKEGKAKAMKLYYYRMKDSFLSFLQPCEAQHAIRGSEGCLFSSSFCKKVLNALQTGCVQITT